MSDTLKELIIKKLIRANIWGGKHTPLDFIRELDRTLKDLINSEWIIIVMKRTGKGSEEHVSLNPRKIQEIRQFFETNQMESSKNL